MEFDTETWGGAIIWLVMLTLLGFAFYRAKTRRRHIGSGAAGAVYGMMNEEKRKALFKEVQIKNAEAMYYIPNVAGAGTGWAGGAASIRNWPEFVTKAYGFRTEVAPFLYRA